MRNIRLNNSHIKVGFDELFYDLIFVVIISKVSMLMINNHDLDVVDILINLVLFLELLFAWRYRLIHNAKVHLLNNKYQQKVASVSLVSYFELIAIIMLLHSADTVSYWLILKIMIIVLIATFLTMTQIRHFVLTIFHRDKNMDELKDKIIDARENKYVNVDYLVERYMILTILFLGEIILEAFLNINNTYILFIVISLVVMYFNTVVQNVNYLLSSINDSNFNLRVYKDINFIFTFLLTITMLFIAYLQLAFHLDNINIYVIILFVFIYIIHMIKLKSKFNLDK